MADAVWYLGVALVKLLLAAFLIGVPAYEVNKPFCGDGWIILLMFGWAVGLVFLFEALITVAAVIVWLTP